MELKKVSVEVTCFNCSEIKEGYKIIYSKGNENTYLCYRCLEELSHTLNNHIADEWLKEETN